MRIYLLALDGVFDTGLAALQDTFSIANDLRHPCSITAAEIAATRVGVGGAVHTAAGLTVPTVAADLLPAPDVVVVPAIGVKTPEALRHALSHSDIQRAATLLRKWHAEGATVAAACTGTFILAEAGLLAGKAATTSWWLGTYFKSRYPDVHLDDSQMIVNAGGVVTAGATLAHFDLALWLIRRSSPALSSLAARYLITDPRSSQPAYAVPDQLRHDDAVVERFEHWARTHLASGFSVKSAADAIGTSTRTLARRVKQTVGKSPMEFVQDLRIERAVYLIEMTNFAIADIAEQVGYTDSVTLRLLIRKRTGRRVGEIRRSAFNPAPASGAAQDGARPSATSRIQ
ncbi:GlxA family transcriptional regulator [Hyphomicrobium sp.]|uniref:GlxA family transcriptional regulator n=1 Tax=Hyphomicrobium sp. TaxID=82 RepID=UPI003F70029A